MYSIEKSFRFNGRSIILYGDGDFNFGKDSYVGSLSTLQSVSGCKINIGEKCRISHNVRIYTQSALADSDFSLDIIPQKKGDVIIEKYLYCKMNNRGVLYDIKALLPVAKSDE